MKGTEEGEEWMRKRESNVLASAGFSKGGEDSSKQFSMKAEKFTSQKRRYKQHVHVGTCSWTQGTHMHAFFVPKWFVKDFSQPAPLELST